MAVKSQNEVIYKRNTINIWFPDQIEPDIEDIEEFKAYWKREKDRCINGFMIGDNQVYISGWLYFHTVYWTIELDQEVINPITGKRTSHKTKGTPLLRDNEWIVADDLERAEIEKGIYDLVACRGVGKSVWSSSFIGQSYTFYDDSENILSGGNNPDIYKLAEKVALGLDNIHPVFQKQRVKNNWKQEVRAGWIDKSTGTTKGSNSRIITRNYDNGNNSMATNGTRPKRQILDEQGKVESLIPCILDSQPSWMNDFGFFSIVFLTGTGGDFEVGEDAGIIFNNPEIYNVIPFDDVWEGTGKIGRFIPVTLGRNEYKEDWTLYKFLKEKYPEKYSDLKHHPDLDVIIKVSNEERCMKEFVIPRREKALKSTSSNEIIKEKAYYPIVPSECFLTINSNDFPVEAAKQHQQFIRDASYKPVRVELYVDSKGQIAHKFTDKEPVRDYPITSSSNKEGVIEIVEFPMRDVKWGTYCAGMDPYKISESLYSDSLGSVVIWKRMTDDMSEPYQNMPVAWYHGRPKEIKKWYENARLLIEYYNASCMMENADAGFKDYMESLNKLHYLAKGQSILKEISPNSKHQGTIGLPPTPAVISHWNNSLVTYSSEILSSQKNEEGEIEESLGITRILDIMTLEEMVKFDGKKNADRVRATAIACAYAKQLDSLLGVAKTKEEVYKEKIKYINSPFNLNQMKSKFTKINSPFSMGRKSF